MSLTRPTLDQELAEPESKRKLNLEIFSRAAKEYDFITRALSLGRDQAWKRRLVKDLPHMKAPVCVDLATGTGDLAALVANRYGDADIMGVDLTPEMIALAKQKHGARRQLRFCVGDMTNLKEFANQSVDIVTGGYAIRNAPDLKLALEEVRRILKPGGTAAFLDFSRPPNGDFIGLLALKFWGGFWGLLLHRQPWVYGCIANSLQRFPDRKALGELFTSLGFQMVHRRIHAMGGVETIMVKTPAG
jgi:demethylmenaquinone methyltransferase/2-methoxy-6-polyprenyl-1,4-benzoquinol methylase